MDMVNLEEYDRVKVQNLEDANAFLRRRETELLEEIRRLRNENHTLRANLARAEVRSSA